MYISKIKLENFKTFNSLEIDCNENFNVIVGENNIGKSTIFEALLLWKSAYDSLIQSKDRKKFYKASSNYYMPFSDFHHIRLFNDDDIFFNPGVNSAAITLVVTDDQDVFSLMIRFDKPGIKNSYFRIYNNDYFSEFERFANHVRGKSCSLKNAIFLYQTRPVSTVYKNEPFYNNAQIEKKISIGKSHDVLRNKILKTENTQATRVSEKFQDLEGRLNTVLGKEYSIKFKNKNRIDEEYVRITAECPSHRELELSMMGSGFLQVAEIFATLGYIERNIDGICLILIDEPDSHIHSDLQSQLIDELKSHNDSQLLVISHNDRLISKVSEGELFFLNETVKDSGSLKALTIDDFPTVKEGLASILTTIERAEDKPIVLVEGKTDQKILTTAWEKIFGNIEIPFIFIASGIQINENERTGSADTVRRSLEYVANLLDHRIIGLFDNDKAGNESYKGLNSNVFQPYMITNEVRRHREKDIFGLLLPVPDNRAHFVNQNKITQRYFVIEHYFSDEVLEVNDMKDDPIIEGASVFQIKGSKKTFADRCANLPVEEFDSFRMLFEKLDQIILSTHR
ncbi:ATP-dependent endonuclease [Cobetia sp. 5-11-6-3]|uniref:ATP-dependent nuclease n=1 Tax=Cobetia sp. 5-11-6-3 TaxID=2737458 RepID=UPI001596DD6C|nr:AAA family ATPase [Cobetia sp. 5-11-6-3]